MGSCELLFFFQAEDGIRDLIVTGVQTCALPILHVCFFFQAEDGIRDLIVTGVQTCALPISFLPVVAFAANPATVETRSPNTSLVVDLVPVGADVEYSARVTDLRSGELLATAK